MIVKYLTALLAKYDKVVVPRLGTFTVNATAAELVGEEILPPSRKITFYEYEVDDNNLLRTTVTQAENLSDTEFNDKVKDFVESLRTQITIFGSYEVEGLGKFSKDEAGVIQFDAEEQQRFIGDSFGLPKITYQTIGSKGQEEATVTTDEAPTKSKTTTPHNNMTLEDEKEKWKSSELVWWLVVIPLLFVFAFLIYLFTQKDAMDRFRSFFAGGTDNPVALNVSEKKSYENFQGQKPETVITAEQGDNSAKNSATVEPETRDKEVVEQPTSQPAKEAQSGKYYIVLGSFSSEDKASKAKNSMEGKGVSSMVVTSKDGKLYRVTYATEFVDEKSAAEKIKEVSEKLGVQVWIAKY